MTNMKEFLEEETKQYDEQEASLIDAFIGLSTSATIIVNLLRADRITAAMRKLKNMAKKVPQINDLLTKIKHYSDERKKKRILAYLKKYGPKKVREKIKS